MYTFGTLPTPSMPAPGAETKRTPSIMSSGFVVRSMPFVISGAALYLLRKHLSIGIPLSAIILYYGYTMTHMGRW